MARSEIQDLFRKELRVSKKLDPKKEILIVKNGTVEENVAAELLKEIFNGRVNVSFLSTTKMAGARTTSTMTTSASATKTITRTSVTTKTSARKSTTNENVFVATSLENDLVERLREFLDDEPVKRPYRSLLETIPEQFILAYAKRHGLKGKPRAPKATNDDVRELLERLQTSQPQTKHSLRKSFDHLGRFPKKSW